MKKVYILLLSLLGVLNAQTDEMLDLAWDIWWDDMDTAISLTHDAYDIALENGDIKNMGRAMSYRAIFYDIEGYADSALFLFHKAIPLQESVKDTVNLITTYNNLGIFYFNQYQFENASENYTRAYELSLAQNDYAGAAGTLVNMGIIESYKDGHGKAIDYYAEAERLYLLDNDSLALTPVWSNSAKIYYEEEEYDKAYTLISKCIFANEDNKAVTDYITERVLMTNILIGMKRYGEAEKFAIQALKAAEQNKVPERKQYVYEVLSKLYYHKGDLEKTWVYSNRYRDLRDSLVNENRANYIAELEVQNRLQKSKVLKAELQLETEKRKTLGLERDKFQFRFYSILIAAGIGVVVLVVLILLLLNTIKLEKLNSKLLEDKSKHANELLDKEKMLMRESHHRTKNNLQLVNSILGLQQRTYNDPMIKNILAESRKRIDAIAIAHQRLYGDDNIKEVNIKSFIVDLVNTVQQAAIDPSKEIEIKCDIDDTILPIEKAISIGLIINELVTNALKHAFVNQSSGTIEIKLGQLDSELRLSIADNGNGLKHDPDEAAGFGHQFLKSMIRQLKAEYTVDGNNGVHHKFIIPHQV